MHHPTDSVTRDDICRRCEALAEADEWRRTAMRTDHHVLRHQFEGAEISCRWEARRLPGCPACDEYQPPAEVGRPKPSEDDSAEIAYERECSRTGRGIA